MKSGRLASIVAMIIYGVAMPLSLAAQEAAKLHHPHQYHHYQIVDPGTFGGPQSYLSQVGGLPRAGILNNQGTLTGAADTLTVDPYCFWTQDCYASHAFRWRNGVKTDLGVLSGGIGSQVNWISANGLIVGISDHGQQDPLAGGLLEFHAVLWQHGGMTDLGTLPAGGHNSWPNAVNNHGEVVGQANNTIPDAYEFNGYGYQSRAFYWKNGVMQDLGTLGTGTDALAGLINEQGQVVGMSYTNSIPSPICPDFGFALTTSTFIWDEKIGMRDIGGLGGTCTLAFDLNNRGQIVGDATRADDQSFHPFVWDPETGITELPTNAGLSGDARAISGHGEVVGTGDAPGANGGLDAMLWRKIAGIWQKTDLGALNVCSIAMSVNASSQVIGDDGCAGFSSLPFLWEEGGTPVDLNTLVSPNSGIQMTEAQQINDRGEIAAEGTDANGNNHAVLLIPCDEHHPDVDGCDYNLVDAAVVP